MGEIQVYVVTENRLVREALAKMFHKNGDLRVAGASGMAPNLPDEVAAVGPDVLLSDPGICALHHLRVIPELRKAVPGLKVILIGMDNDKQTFLRAVGDGVLGYMLKDASSAEIAAAVRSVMSGEAVCPPSLCQTLFEYFASQSAQIPSFQVRHGLGLTRREQQLVEMIARGLTNKEIASELNLSENTVKNHVHRMLRKLGATGRLEVVESCRLQGLSA